MIEQRTTLQINHKKGNRYTHVVLANICLFEGWLDTNFFIMSKFSTVNIM